MLLDGLESRPRWSTVTEEHIMSQQMMKIWILYTLSTIKQTIYYT